MNSSLYSSSMPPFGTIRDNRPTDDDNNQEHDKATPLSSWTANRMIKSSSQNPNDYKQTHLYDGIYNRPVETPPDASFSSGLQFHQAMNPYPTGNPNTTRSMNGGNKSLAINAMTTAAAARTSTIGENPPYHPSRDFTPPSFGLSVSSMNHDTKMSSNYMEHSAMTGLGVHHPSVSSSMLGLRQRRNYRNGTSHPPPKRSMMHMNMDMTANSKNAESTPAITKDSILITDQEDKENKSDAFQTTNKGGIFSFSQKKLDEQSVKEQQQQHSQMSAASMSRTHYHHLGKQMDYNHWVVLYGFSSDSQCSHILGMFEKYGTIVSKYPSQPRGASSSNNWICIEYESSLQADKALCQHGTLIDASRISSGVMKDDRNPPHSSDIIIVGVMRMDKILADRLGLLDVLHGESDIVGEEHARKRHGGVPNVIAQGNSDDKKESSKMERIGIEGSMYKSKLQESDVLLMGSEKGNRKGDDNLHFDMVMAKNRQGLLYKILAWIFEW